MKLLLASHNYNKRDEIRALLPAGIELVCLSDIGINEEIAETGKTLEENAIIKAESASLASGMPAFADDTGLEVKALNGLPGVRSARFAGDKATMSDNICKLLAMMNEREDRKARFRTVIALIDGSTTKLFEGIVEGVLALEPRGSGGFGYDPLFIPDGYTHTFAEMSPEMKNSISHRSVAIARLTAHLTESSMHNKR